ncbi:hypothetical protein [Pontibacter rugosus]|uniref:Uncharacterized protein n=1 Tax=Pontibacter rugosus TaxID=1745966 RepID=A0ABW3SLR0_9BACT
MDKKRAIERIRFFDAMPTLKHEWKAELEAILKQYPDLKYLK